MSTHKGYLPQREGDIAKWLLVFNRGIGKYGATLGLSPAEITDGQANCAFGGAVIEVQDEATAYAKSITQFKQAALWATGPCTAWPAGYTLPATLPPVSHAGVLALITLLVKRLKAHPAYTVDIGKELGIEGAAPVVTAAASVAEAKPLLKLRLDTGGHPLVLWKKGDMEGVEIWVDRGDGKGSALLAFDTMPDYLDTATLPAVGASAVWTYKAIYHIGGGQIGQWSDDVKISVMGR